MNRGPSPARYVGLAGKHSDPYGRGGGFGVGWGDYPTVRVFPPREPGPIIRHAYPDPPQFDVVRGSKSEKIMPCGRVRQGSTQATAQGTKMVLLLPALERQTRRQQFSS